MKKVVVSVLALLGIVGVGKLIYSHAAVSASPASAMDTPTADSSASFSSPSTTTSATTQPTTTGFKNGNYTGQAVSTRYGTVQVQAVIGGGKITNVVFLQLPNDAGHTQEVTALAKPLLLQETLQAQSASVDSVSGATQTSEGFVQSLQSALTQDQ